MPASSARTRSRPGTCASPSSTRWSRRARGARRLEVPGLRGGADGHERRPPRRRLDDAAGPPRSASAPAPSRSSSRRPTAGSAREVTVVQRGEHLAHGEDEELGDLLKAYLEEEGIAVLTGSAVGAPRARRRAAGGRVRGRQPRRRRRDPDGGRSRLERRGPRARGARDLDRRRPDPRPSRACARRCRSIWAAGDAHGEMLFTHVATYEAPTAVANMLDGTDGRARLPHDAARDLHRPRPRLGRAHGAPGARGRLRGRGAPLRRRHPRQGPRDRRPARPRQVRPRRPHRRDPRRRHPRPRRRRPPARARRWR